MRQMMEFHEYYLKREKVIQEIKSCVMEEKESILLIEGGAAMSKQSMIRQTAKDLKIAYICVQKDKKRHKISMIENEEMIAKNVIIHFDSFNENEINAILKDKKEFPAQKYIISTRNSSDITMRIKKSV